MEKGRSDQKFSPLLDPLILDSRDAVVKAEPVGHGKALLGRLSRFNWTWILVNIIIPCTAILIVAFLLKSRYDRKKDIYDEYMVMDLEGRL